MALGSRLAEALRAKGMNQTALAKASGTEPATIQAVISRDSGQSKYALAWARALGIRYEWLIDGEGPMVDDGWDDFFRNMDQAKARKEGPPASLDGYALARMSTWDDATPLDPDDVEIPLFKEIEIAAGDGATHSVEINGRKLRFSKATLKAAGVDAANAACATVTGNSMERLISDGATIGVDRGRTQIRDGEIYAIDHDGMLRVKYLYRMPGGGLRLRSENSGEHPDEILTQEQAQRIRVLGWVFWWSTLRTWGGR